MADSRKKRETAQPSQGTSPPRTKTSAQAKAGPSVLLNTAAMAGSSLWRILISFVLQLFVARTLGFPALGQYTVALAYLNVCQILTELGLQNLLVRDLAQTPHARRSYFLLSLRLQLVASVIIWGILWFATSLLPYSDSTQNALRLVGASLPFYTLTISCQTLFQSAERMDLVMIVELVTNTLIGLLSILVLLNQGSVVHLIGVLIGTQAISASFCLLLLYKAGLLDSVQESDGNEIRQDNQPHVAHQVLRSSLPFYGLSLADVLLQRLDILIISAIGGETITGIYSAAYNVVRILLKLIQSYWKALYPTFSRLLDSNKKQYKSLCETSLKYGVLLILFAATIGMVGAEFMLELIYGENTSGLSGVYRILIWSAPLFFIESYAITLLMAEDRPNHSLFIMGIHLAAVCLFLPILTSAYGVIGAAWSVLLSLSLGTILSISILHRFKIPLEVKNKVLLFVPAVVVGFGVSFASLNQLWSIASGIMLYLALTWLCGIVTGKDIRTLRSNLVRKV